MKFLLHNRLDEELVNPGLSVLMENALDLPTRRTDNLHTWKFFALHHLLNRFRSVDSVHHWHVVIHENQFVELAFGTATVLGNTIEKFVDRLLSVVGVIARVVHGIEQLFHHEIVELVVVNGEDFGTSACVFFADLPRFLEGTVSVLLEHHQRSLSHL